MSDDENNADLLQRLQELRIEHRDLDDVIMRLALSVDLDQLQLRRLKKRKLYLKDTIAKLESKLIPDLDALYPGRYHRRIGMTCIDDTPTPPFSGRCRAGVDPPFASIEAGYRRMVMPSSVATQRLSRVLTRPTFAF